MKNFTYANPVLFQEDGHTQELRDPCVIREGDMYYLVFTVYPFTHHTSKDPGKPDYNSSPGIKLYSSPDLMHWKFEKWLVKSSELPESCPYKHRFWAPEIAKINGKFYLTFTADNWIKKEYNPAGDFGLHAFIGVADQVTGPYEHITNIVGAGCDTSIFGDDDGRTYAYIPAMDVFVQEIDLTQLENGKVSLIGERKRVVTAKNEDIGLDWNYKYLEGTWAFKDKGRYYLLYAGVCKDGWDGTGDISHDKLEYWSGVSYADSPMGPFTKDKAGKAFFGGHLVTFKGPDGRNWFSYRCEKDDSIRGLLCFDPFDIDENGDMICYPPTKGTVTIKL